jgi:tetratricopeptide (TPR) repeat protein
MDSSVQVLKVVAQVAGIGGLSIGLVLLVFRDTLRQKIFPQLDPQRAFHLLVLIIVLTAIIGLAGLASWVYLQARASTTAVESSRDFLERGNSFEREGRYEDAVAQFKKAAQLDPGWGEPVVRLAQTYQKIAVIRRGDDCSITDADKLAFDYYKKALNEYKLAATEATQFTEWVLAGSAWETGNVDEAISHLLQYVALTPQKDGVIHGRIQVQPGDALPAGLRLNMELLPRFAFFGCFWNAQGEFLTTAEAGTYFLQTRLIGYEQYALPVRISVNELTSLPPYMLRKSSAASSVIQADVRLTSATERRGVLLRIYQPGQPQFFLGESNEDGKAAVRIPSSGGIWVLGSLHEGHASIWQTLRLPPQRIQLDLGEYQIGRVKRVHIQWRLNPEPGSVLFRGKSLQNGDIVLTGFEQFKRGFSFVAGAYRAGECTDHPDLSIRQSGDSHTMTAVGKMQSTEGLDFFPGPFACGPPGHGGLADLGAKSIENIYDVGDIPEPVDMRAGVRAIPGHVYALRTYDGRNYVLFKVTHIDDVIPAAASGS